MFAHRGVGPENTLPALRTARRRGLGVECDVRLSRDRVPVIVHDRTLRRTHSRPDAVADLSADALRAIGVPTLAEVVREFADWPMIFDLKEEALLPHVACYGRPNFAFLVWGDDWHWPGLRLVRARGYRFPPEPRVACKFNGSAVNRACIARALAAGGEVNLWAPDGRHARRMLRLYRGVERVTFTVDVPNR